MNLYILIFLFVLSSCLNYIAFRHVTRYNYFKTIVSTKWEEIFLGVLLGLPFIFLPFVLTSKDKGYMKSKRVKNVVIGAQFSIALIIVFILYLAVNYYLERIGS